MGSRPLLLLGFFSNCKTRCNTGPGARCVRSFAVCMVACTCENAQIWQTQPGEMISNQVRVERLVKGYLQSG